VRKLKDKLNPIVVCSYCWNHFHVVVIKIPMLIITECIEGLSAEVPVLCPDIIISFCRIRSCSRESIKCIKQIAEVERALKENSINIPLAQLELIESHKQSDFYPIFGVLIGRIQTLKFTALFTNAKLFTELQLCERERERL